MQQDKPILNAANSLSEELRTKVYNMLGEALLYALEELNEDTFSFLDSQRSAEFIAVRLDDISTMNELFFFLKQLSEQWPVYASVYDQLLKEDLLTKVNSELQTIKKI